ncbi:hypothetical protein Dvina_01395 [Dactylosporangium vinaceum]|uniref:Uncharacterized protein n=1 Tax=Dactylosporangium vinaceum TaxID=53362 RepID=A0ABV5MLN2_9ACTN|nr:hypothetical protein [Dactylosporangium vinaceum]UAB96913.1 hypothetical protein Dvina_01395 [Dactylosporangium vinaceum]
MTIIVPTPAEARDLRTAFTHNGVVDRAEQALRTVRFVTDVATAAELLPTWAYADTLTERERRAVLARFMCPELVGDGDEQRVCGEQVTTRVSHAATDTPWRDSYAACDSCADRLTGPEFALLGPERTSLILWGGK